MPFPIGTNTNSSYTGGSVNRSSNNGTIRDYRLNAMGEVEESKPAASPTKDKVNISDDARGDHDDGDFSIPSLGWLTQSINNANHQITEEATSQAKRRELEERTGKYKTHH